LRPAQCGLVRISTKVSPQSVQTVEKNENVEPEKKSTPKIENDNVKKIDEQSLKPNSEKEVAADKKTAQSMVNELIVIASKNGGLNNELEIQELINKINSIPKPLKGNSKEARKINDKGLLALSNNEDFDSAVRLFSEAQKLDPADVEILNNLGFAYMKQQNFNMAEKTLIEALTLSPARSSAWSNLGDVFALKDNESKAIACYAHTYRFSQNKINTHQFMKKVNFEEEVPFVEDVRGKAIIWAKNAYQLN
jgi:tetratricopeptide (TPR) repeat protein